MDEHLLFDETDMSGILFKDEIPVETSHFPPHTDYEVIPDHEWTPKVRQRSTSIAEKKGGLNNMLIPLVGLGVLALAGIIVVIVLWLQMRDAKKRIKQLESREKHPLRIQDVEHALNERSIMIEKKMVNVVNASYASMRQHITHDLRAAVSEVIEGSYSNVHRQQQKAPIEEQASTEDTNQEDVREFSTSPQPEPPEQNLKEKEGDLVETRVVEEEENLATPQETSSTNTTDADAIEISDTSTTTSIGTAEAEQVDQ